MRAGEHDTWHCTHVQAHIYICMHIYTSAMWFILRLVEVKVNVEVKVKVNVSVKFKVHVRM